LTALGEELGRQAGKLVERQISNEMRNFEKGKTRDYKLTRFSSKFSGMASSPKPFRTLKRGTLKGAR
jgi:hypothetical protein